MKEVTVWKAQETGNIGIESVSIIIDEELPYTQGMSLSHVEELHMKNAEKIVDALLSSLPQGTTDRVIGLLLQHRATLFLAPMFTGVKK